MSMLKRARLVANMTLGDAAKELKIPAGYLSQIENGKRHVSSERASQIASIYKVKVEDIFLPTRYSIREVDGTKEVS